MKPSKDSKTIQVVMNPDILRKVDRIRDRMHRDYGSQPTRSTVVRSAIRQMYDRLFASAAGET